uniref:Uncharacterized protein n=1 Tax=Rhizophora mucronata TaxID=61149 RepID=A0A2P2MV14_RHIMU
MSWWDNSFILKHLQDNAGDCCQNVF